VTARPALCPHHPAPDPHAPAPRQHRTAPEPLTLPENHGLATKPEPCRPREATGRIVRFSR
jgi:hypothetical protein